MKTQKNPSLFHASHGEELSIPEVIDEVCAFMDKEKSYTYRITIGTDSERLFDNDADFVSAVVVHRVGNGGRDFWRRIKQGPYHTLRDRIIEEVLMSLHFAETLLRELNDKYPSGGEHPEWTFEVHADVGENGPTKEMIQEVLGMIRAYNFEPRMKPESYAASHVADRHV